MALPDPEPGLVISDNDLWHHEHNSGRDEGTKSRPCVIVLAMEGQADGTILVRVVPVTHSPPRLPEVALEIPASVKRHLGLEDARSWVILDEVNEFAWLGFDLAPYHPYATPYGLLPARLFERLVVKLARVWSEGQGKITLRD
jgi:hypothetical protein